MVNTTSNSLTPGDLIDILNGNYGGFELPDFPNAEPPPEIPDNSDSDFGDWLAEPVNLMITVLSVLAGVLIFKNI